MTIDRLTMHEMKVRRITIVSGYASIDKKQKDAVIDIANELEDYMISVEKAYEKIWQYVDETTPNEKEKDNE